MKNIVIPGSLMVILMLLSCSSDENHDLLHQKKTYDLDQKNNRIEAPIRSSSELIVSFKTGVTNGQKDKLRSKYGVKYFERCNCSNERIEKWVFGRNINIEERMGDISQETDVEGTDFQYYHINNDKNTGITISNSYNSDALTYLNNTSNTVNIGVLDTGINLNIINTDAPFLYHADRNQNACLEVDLQEIAGWDFVNNDNDPNDEIGHGTAVTSRIINEISKTPNINFSILPVKVFNHEGKGNTFDILCGYLFTVKKENIHIINMSFGWYGAPSNLLELYVQENSNIFHITSAGNHDYNNDNIDHFPSSIPYDNVLAIGSYTIQDLDLNTVLKSSFSNYGDATVDYLSEGENILFEDVHHNQYLLNGTSYATPIVTGKIASYYYNQFPTPIYIGTIYQELWDNAIVLPKNELPVVHNDRIIK